MQPSAAVRLARGGPRFVDLERTGHTLDGPVGLRGPSVEEKMEDTTGWSALLARLRAAADRPSVDMLTAVESALRADRPDEPGAPPREKGLLGEPADLRALPVVLATLGAGLGADTAEVRSAAVHALRAVLARAEASHGGADRDNLGDAGPSMGGPGPLPLSRRRGRIAVDSANAWRVAQAAARRSIVDPAPRMQVGMWWTGASADGAPVLLCWLHPGPPRIEFQDGHAHGVALLSTDQVLELLHRIVRALPMPVAMWRSQTYAADEALGVVCGDDAWTIECGSGHFTGGPLAELAWVLDERARA